MADTEAEIEGNEQANEQYKTADKAWLVLREPLSRRNATGRLHEECKKSRNQALGLKCRDGKYGIWEYGIERE
jgi:hypothetical protein